NPLQIRLTRWPPVPTLAIPDAETNKVLAVAGEWNVLVYGDELPPVRGPDEFVFGALLDADCGDAYPIAAWERAHGRLSTTLRASLDHEGKHFPRFVAAEPTSWGVAPRASDEAWRRRRVAVLSAQYPNLVDSDEIKAFVQGWVNTDDTQVADWSMNARALR